MKIITPFRLLACMLLCALIFTCCSDGVAEYRTPKAENEFAANYIYKLFCGDSSYCLSNVTAAVKDTASTRITATCSFLKPLQYDDSRLISVIHDKDEGIFLRYEYIMKGYYIYFEISVARMNSGFVISSFRAYISPKPFSEMQFFIWDHKTSVQYFFILCGALLWLFQIFTIIVISKSTLSKPKKALWISLSAFSLGRITMSWTMGIIWTHFPAFNFTDFFLIRNEKNGQWLLSIYIPLSAIIFWLKRKKILKEDKVEVMADEQIAESYRKLEQDSTVGQQELN